MTSFTSLSILSRVTVPPELPLPALIVISVPSSLPVVAVPSTCGRVIS